MCKKENLHHQFQNNGDIIYFDKENHHTITETLVATVRLKMQKIIAHI